jgi:hypothetical protein
MSDTIRLWDGDMDRLRSIMRTKGIEDAVAEIMRSRGALLDFVLKVANDKSAPERLREEARAVAMASGIRE